MSKNIIKIGGKMFITDFLTVGDMEGIHIKKNEIDHLKKTSMDDAIQMYKDYANLLYPDVDDEYRDYVLIYNLVSSEGKTNYRLGYRCEHCNKDVQLLLSIDVNLANVKVEAYNGISIIFNFTNGGSVEKIMDYIMGIQFGDQIILWEHISESDKESLMSYIPIDDYDEILSRIQLCQATIRGHASKCCDKGVQFPKEQKVYGGFNIFDIMINSPNLTTMYKMNHQLLSRGISLSDQLIMKPFERNIYISMIIKKESEENKKNDKSGISGG